MTILKLQQLAPPRPKTRTLILVNHPGRQSRKDFEEIRVEINTLAPDIDVQIVEAGRFSDALDEQIWQRPCLIVSFATPLGIRPKRGLIFCCRPISKFEQLAKLHRAKVAVPLSAQLVFGQQLDKAVWGPFVVLKPTTPGFMSQGAVYLMRTERVADLAETIFPPRHPSLRLPVLVQKFVDTGKWPSYYRVLTLFGEPLYCLRGYTSFPRPSLDVPDDVLLKLEIAPNRQTANLHPRYFSSNVPVLELARRAYGAMPAIPLQAVDIVREEATGRLFVLEINAGGNTWHFSSTHIDDRIRALPPELQRDTITREQRIAQFGAWNAAARVLIMKTREQAL